MQAGWLALGFATYLAGITFFYDALDLLAERDYVASLLATGVGLASFRAGQVVQRTALASMLYRSNEPSREEMRHLRTGEEG